MTEYLLSLRRVVTYHMTITASAPAPCVPLQIIRQLFSYESGKAYGTVTGSNLEMGALEHRPEPILHADVSCCSSLV